MVALRIRSGVVGDICCGGHAGNCRFIGDVAVFRRLHSGDPGGEPVAGIPAGIFAVLVTIPIVWWAFMPPHFEFNPLTKADYDRFAMFLLWSSLAVYFSHLYREALVLLRK